MGIVVVVVIGFFIAVQIAIAMESSDSQTEQTPTAIAKTVKTYGIGDSIIISGLSYTVENAYTMDTLPGVGIWHESKESQVLRVDVKVKNVGKDPERELYGRSFSLEDSQDRRYSVLYVPTAYGDRLGTIQPGLSAGGRAAVFEIPRDDSVEYSFIIENKVVHLGKVLPQACVIPHTTADKCPAQYENLR